MENKPKLTTWDKVLCSLFILFIATVVVAAMNIALYLTELIKF